MKFFMTVIGLLLIMEGLPYFTFPENMQAFLKQIGEMPPNHLRWVGFVSTLVGMGICYIAQKTGIFS